MGVGEEEGGGVEAGRAGMRWGQAGRRDGGETGGGRREAGTGRESGVSGGRAGGQGGGGRAGVEVRGDGPRSGRSEGGTGTGRRRLGQEGVLGPRAHLPSSSTQARLQPPCPRSEAAPRAWEADMSRTSQGRRLSASGPRFLPIGRGQARAPIGCQLPGRTLQGGASVAILVAPHGGHLGGGGSAV